MGIGLQPVRSLPSLTQFGPLIKRCPVVPDAKTCPFARYKLVKEALRERKYFLNTAPHLSQWLPIMVPVQKLWQAPYFWAGCKAYDFLAGSEGIESSYFLTKSKAIDAFPMLKREDVVGAMVYYGKIPHVHAQMERPSR